MKRQFPRHHVVSNFCRKSRALHLHSTAFFLAIATFSGRLSCKTICRPGQVTSRKTPLFQDFNGRESASHEKALHSGSWFWPPRARTGRKAFSSISARTPQVPAGDDLLRHHSQSINPKLGRWGRVSPRGAWARQDLLALDDIYRIGLKNKTELTQNESFTSYFLSIWSISFSKTHR